jgi:starch phosphorylase
MGPDLLARENGAPVKLVGPDGGLEGQLIHDHVIDPGDASLRKKYHALARSIRDLFARRWVKTEQTWDSQNVKRAYYVSMEFLIGASLENNVVNLGLEAIVSEACREVGVEFQQLIDEEPDAGLGNGGLGRLAACFIDSLATLSLPAMGYGLRYEYGIFRQMIRDGRQHEIADNWLSQPDPWEVTRNDEAVEIPLGCGFEMHGGSLRALPGQPTTLIGVPHDRPVVGWGGRTIGTLRLWSAHSPNRLDFAQFSSGDFVSALTETLAGKTITRVLYPDDSTMKGRGLRFVQQVLLVSASLADIVRRVRRNGNDWHALADKAAIQLNDTHPTLAVSELMRILLDEASLGWDEAWQITQRTLAYTNHTLLPEALEKWPLRWFQLLIPRQLEIIYEINRRFLDEVERLYPGDAERRQRMSIFEEGDEIKVRMAHLAIIGSHSVNGVAAIHTDLLRKTVVDDFAEMMPEKFNNKTNGITQRRWLRVSNPALSKIITEAIGDGWITDGSEFAKLKPFAEDAGFRDAVREAKLAAKKDFVGWLDRKHGIKIDPGFIFDSQVKRIHEYKRQLLNVLHIVMLYNRLRDDPDTDIPPRVFIFSGKAAPAYHFAKLIIKLINNISATIEADEQMRQRLRVVFVPDYSVTVAQHLIPASEVSEQLSTAGYEASGTGNMKFMMNGALTVGTRDGATIEMAEEAGEKSLFLFGLTAEQVAQSRPWYSPRWHYENEPEVRVALDTIADNHFSPYEPGIFTPVGDALLHQGDRYMHLADLTAYAQAQKKVGETYKDPDKWARLSVLNIAGSGKFSSDRTISQYAKEIWDILPCPVPEPKD